MDSIQKVLTYCSNMKTLHLTKFTFIFRLLNMFRAVSWEPITWLLWNLLCSAWDRSMLMWPSVLSYFLDVLGFCSADHVLYIRLLCPPIFTHYNLTCLNAGMNILDHWWECEQQWRASETPGQAGVEHGQECQKAAESMASAGTAVLKSGMPTECQR